MSSPRPARVPLRVLMIVVTDYRTDARVRRQAEALVARGDEVTVLALQVGDEPLTREVNGVRVVELPIRKYRGASAGAYLKLYGRFTWRALWWAAAHRRDFDLVQAHSMPETLVFCGLPQRLRGLPILLDVHDLTSKTFEEKFASRPTLLGSVRMSERASMRFSTEVITANEPYAELLRGLTGTRVTSVLNCPDDTLFRPRPFRDWEPGGEFTVGYHGLIAERQGVFQAVEAVALLRAELPGLRLRIRGSGDDAPRLHAHIAELGVADMVDFDDSPIAVTDLPAELDRLHLGLVPHQLGPLTRDILPNKIMEYAGVGVPIVTFRNDTVRRYFDERAVVFADPADGPGLAAAIAAVAADPVAARRRSEYTLGLMADRVWSRQRGTYFEVIDRMTGRSASPGTPLREARAAS